MNVLFLTDEKSLWVNHKLFYIIKIISNIVVYGKNKVKLMLPAGLASFFSHYLDFEELLLNILLLDLSVLYEYIQLTYSFGLSFVESGEFKKLRKYGHLLGGGDTM